MGRMQIFLTGAQALMRGRTLHGVESSPILILGSPDHTIKLNVNILDFSNLNENNIILILINEKI